MISFDSFKNNYKKPKVVICQSKNLCGSFLICKNSQKRSQSNEFSKFAWTIAPDAPNIQYLSCESLILARKLENIFEKIICS